LPTCVDGILTKLIREWSFRTPELSLRGEA
jgi:hypothetical protein